MAAEGGKQLPVLTPESIKNLCFHCKKEGPTKTCVACGIARYCSRECQQEAREGHKDNCKKVKNHRTRTNRLEAELRDEWAGDGCDYESWVGNFWGSVDARDFCRAKQLLAITLVEIAGSSENNYTSDPEGYLALMEAETHFLELLRLSHGDNQGIRMDYPFVLLALGRVQDCYDFVHWWATVDPDGTYDWGTPARKFQRGEWMYASGQDMKEDLFADPRVGDTDFFNTFHLMALILVKLHLIEQLKKGEETRGDSDTGAALKQQEQLLLRYCEMMQKSNKWVLEGVVNPEPLLAPGLPSGYSMKSIEEARLVVHSARIVSDKKFEAREKIKGFLGMI